jgi:hypothetical protein
LEIDVQVLGTEVQQFEVSLDMWHHGVQPRFEVLVQVDEAVPVDIAGARMAGFRLIGR